MHTAQLQNWRQETQHSKRHLFRLCYEYHRKPCSYNQLHLLVHYALFCFIPEKAFTQTTAVGLTHKNTVIQNNKVNEMTRMMNCHRVLVKQSLSNKMRVECPKKLQISCALVKLREGTVSLSPSGELQARRTPAQTNKSNQ